MYFHINILQTRPVSSKASLSMLGGRDSIETGQARARFSFSGTPPEAPASSAKRGLFSQNRLSVAKPLPLLALDAAPFDDESSR